jgi:hypothetical protein
MHRKIITAQKNNIFLTLNNKSKKNHWIKAVLFIFSVIRNKNFYKVRYLLLHRDHLNIVHLNPNILVISYFRKVCSIKRFFICFKQHKRRKIYLLVQIGMKLVNFRFLIRLLKEVGRVVVINILIETKVILNSKIWLIYYRPNINDLLERI